MPSIRGSMKGREAYFWPSGKIARRKMTAAERRVANRRNNEGLIEPGADRRPRPRMGKSRAPAPPWGGNMLATVLSLWPLLAAWAVVMAQIFGGCCSNVFALEAIVKDWPQSGPLITFVQFLVTAAITWPSQFSWDKPPFFLKTRAVPMVRWIPQILMFAAVNLLNNFAFGYNISVPVHIIIRSGGSVMTMLVGYAWGKRYTRMQVYSVSMITIGIIIAAMADAHAKGKTKASSTSLYDPELLTGLTILFVAQLLSAAMGLYVQITYDEYGKQWNENLFYSHFLSLPLFLIFKSSLLDQWHQLASSPPITLLPFPPSTLKPAATSQPHATLPPILLSTSALPTIVIPKQIANLFLNALTQYACIRGVNILATKTTALGVSIALNVRKLVSLFISLWLFGNVLPAGVIVGAAIVFGSASLWAWEGQRIRREQGRESRTGGEKKRE